MKNKEQNPVDYLNHVIGHHWALIILTISLSIVAALMYWLRTVIFPFALGLALAYLLYPIVSWLETRLRRPVRSLGQMRVPVITGGYALTFVVFGSAAFYIGNTTFRSFMSLVNEAPSQTVRAMETVYEWPPIHGLFSAQVQQNMDLSMTDIGTAMGNTVQMVVSNGVKLLPENMGLVMGLVSLPIFLFYLLKDWEKITASFYGTLPDWSINHARNMLNIIGNVLGKYLRTQALLGLINGGLMFIGLTITGVPFAPVIALACGVGEVIPVIGAWISGITAAVITLAVAPDKAVWVLLVFMAVKAIIDFILLPRMQATSLDLHPALVIMLLVIGPFIAGFWGLLLVVPVTAIVVKLYQYVHQAARAEDAVDEEKDMRD